MFNQNYRYDVAFSFAGEDRVYAEALAEALRKRGISVFYDKYEQATLWGKNLYTYLSNLYKNEARFCVMFLSQHYAKKLWTNHERESAQARAFQENEEYILPIRLDDTKIPGILPTIGYLSWFDETPDSIANALNMKLGEKTSSTSEQEVLSKQSNYKQIVRQILFEGYQLLNDKEFEKAEKQFNKAQRLEMHLPEPWYWKAKLAFAKGNHLVALRYINKALLVNPSYLHGLAFKVKLLLLMGGDYRVEAQQLANKIQGKFSELDLWLDCLQKENFFASIVTTNTDLDIKCPAPQYTW